MRALVPRRSTPRSRRPLLAVAGVLAVIGALMYWMHASATGARDERDAARAAADREDAALAAQIRARLAPFAAGVASAPAADCPPVNGELALVDEAWLAWILRGGGPVEQRPPAAYDLRSPVFEYLAGAWVATDPRAVAKRHALYAQLAQAPRVLVMSAHTNAAKVDETNQFTGGRTEAVLALADVAAGKLVCQLPVASEPDVLVAIRRPDGDKGSGSHWDTDTAARQAIARAFWRDAAAALAAVAPMATLAAPAPEDM
jgi:hypothetical protein